MVIGLTGGIATGKTTVSNILKKLGARIIDADKIAHEVIKRGETGWKRVVEFFGEDILDNKGEINRSLLGQIIFSDPQKRRKLEELVHPIIIKKIKEELKKLKKETEGTTETEIVVLDAPLLYETGLDRLVDQVWVVYTDQENQLKWLQQRDGLNTKEAQERISSQMNLEQKCNLADRIINNNGNKDDLYERIITIWREINED